jgi:hypothetical protein
MLKYEFIFSDDQTEFLKSVSEQIKKDIEEEQLIVKKVVAEMLATSEARTKFAQLMTQPLIRRIYR